MFEWHYLTLYRMTVDKASLVMVEGNQLLDATIAASLTISQSKAGVSHMH